MSRIALRAENLGKEYRIGGPQTGYHTFREVVSSAARAPLRRLRRTGRPRSSGDGQRPKIWALRDVCFTVGKGEVIGVIGRNGAGKSTLLKVLSRITEPTTGWVEIAGSVGSLLEVGTGFHPELTGRENVFLNGAILGMARVDIQRQFDAIVGFAEVEKFIDTPVKHYSTGMYLRLAFAVAAHLEPEILLVDEVLAVGDIAFQKKCLGKMGEVAHQGRTILFVSHNMGAVRSLCEKGIVLEQGRVVEYASIGKAIETYLQLSARRSEERESADEGVRAGQTGFGPVYLASHPSTTVGQQEPFEVGTTLHIGCEVSGFTLLCLLEDMHQRSVFHLRIDSSDVDADTTRPGSYRIRLKLPALWLEPGLYTLYFKVLFSGALACARHLSDTLHLDVGGRCSGWGAVLTPHAVWDVQMNARSGAGSTAGIQ
jgi:lipopolysaccharide transport system ATP-binding protein